jgi:hypothetical protein
VAPSATIVDITHEVPPQDVESGAFLLWSAVKAFPPGTIHLAVVDPGVGSNRKARPCGFRQSQGRSVVFGEGAEATPDGVSGPMSRRSIELRTLGVLLTLALAGVSGRANEPVIRATVQLEGLVPRCVRLTVRGQP